MISTNTAGGALSAGFLSAIEQTSREWRTRLVDENGDPLDCEIMSFTIHKGTRGQNFSIGTVYAPYFEVSITEYADALMGQEIGLEIAPVITQGTEPTEYARLCTGEVYEVVQVGDAYAVKCAGVLSLKGDLVLTSDSTDVATVISALETLLGVSVVAQGAVATMGLTGTLAQSMKGLTARTALQELATFLGGFVSEDASGDVILGSTYSGTAYEITSDMVQSDPEESGSLEVTGFTVVVQAGGEDAQGQIIPADSYTDGTSVFAVVCPYMTQTQFNRIKSYVTGQTVYGGTVEQAVGNPLLEPWDQITAGDSVFAGAELEITDAVSVTVHSGIITTEEKPTVQVGPMQAQIAEIQEALYTIQDGQQYFWVDPDGAHVTKIPKKQFKANPAGGNTLTDTSGMDVRDGATSLAKFGETTRIGRGERSHAEIDYHSLQLKDKEGNSYFYVSDLRDANGNALIEEIKSAGTGTEIIGVDLDIEEIVSFEVNGEDWLSNIAEVETRTIVLSQSIQTDSEVRIEYKTRSSYAKAYTFGLRKSTGSVGALSVCEGSEGIASGYISHAEGLRTIASGDYSHAEGLGSKATGDGSHAEGTATKASGYYSHAEGDHTTASGDRSHSEGEYTTASGNQSHAQNYRTIAGYSNQTAIGRFNDNKRSNAFEIGNGSNANNRFNAFEVDWDGNATVAGALAAKNGQSDAQFMTIGGSTYSYVEVVFGGRTLRLVSNTNGNIGLYDPDNSKWVIRADTNGAVYASGTDFTIPTSGAAVLSRDLIVGGHSSPIGDIKIAYLQSATSANNNTGTALCSFDLPVGVWEIVAQVRFPTNNTGVRRANITDVSGNNDVHVQQTATQGGQTALQVTRIVEVTTPRTFYLNVYHNAGTALTMPAGNSNGYVNGMRAVRIA